MCACDDERKRKEHLVDFLDAGAVFTGASASWEATWGTSGAAREASRGTTSLTVEPLHDGVGYGLELLLLRLILVLGCFLGIVEPRNSLVDSRLELGLVSSVELVSKLVVGEGVAEVVGVGFETVLGTDRLPRLPKRVPFWQGPCWPRPRCAR